MKRFAAIIAVAAVLAGCRFSVRMDETEKPPEPKVALGKDILYLDKGEEIPGRLESIKPDGTYVFTNIWEKTSEYPAAQVLRVEFQRKRPDDDKKEASQVQDPALQEALKKEVTQERYPNAAYVTIYDSLVVEIGKDRSYTLKRRIIRKVLTRRGLGIANSYVDYLSDRAKAALVFARTITPEGRLRHVDESAIEDGSRFGRYPQYDNARRLKWTLKEVKEGSYTDCAYEVKHSPATMLAPLYVKGFLRSTQPIIHREILVKAAPGVEAAVSGVLTEGVENISSFKRSTPEGTTYGFVAANMPRLEPENMMPPYPDVLPHVVISLKDSWQKTGREYGTEIAKLLPGKDSINPVIVKAHELTDGQERESEKARTIYNFIARDIGFLDIPPTDYGFIPHKPAEVLAAGQANALDKAFLLHAMLKAVGVESALLLAHRRDSGGLPAKNACLWPMSTPLVRVIADGRTHYCYPTTQVIPFGYVPAGVQGSQALIAAPWSKDLVKVPLLPASGEGVKTMSTIELYADGRIHVKRSVDPRGGSEVRWREWSKLKPEEITQKFESIVSNIHPNARLLDCSPRSPKEFGDLNKPVEINYEYEVQDYALTAGGETLVFKAPELDYDASSIRKYERDLPMFWGSRYSFSNTATIKLPEGFRVRSMPEQVQSYEGEAKPFMWYYAGFFGLAEVTEEGEHRTIPEITFNDSFERSSVYEPPQFYPVYIQAIKARAGLAMKWIVVEKEK